MSQREEKGAKASKPQYGIGSNILYLLKLSREVPGLLFQQGLKALINVAISVIGLYLSPTLLSLLEQRRSPGMLLGTLGGFVLALFAVHAAKGYLDQQWIRPLAARANIMNRINAKLGSCSYPLLLNEEFQSKWNQGMKACDGNGSAATEVIWRTMFLIPENMICFGVYLALLTRVQPFLILITLLTSGLGYIITYHFVQKEHRYQEEGAAPYRKDHVLLQTVCDSRLAKDVRIFGMREWLEGMHNQYQRLAEDIQKRRGINNFLGDMASLGLNFLRNGIAYAYLLAITLKGDLPAGEFLLYFTAVTGFTAWITGILNGFNDLHRQSIEISAIREFINFPEPFLMEGGKKPVLNSRMGGTFELRNVSYRYPRGEKPVFSHLNLTIGPGEKLAVVGENGAGKTTLIKLLCGFLDPDEGQVLLNGVDIREYNRREYYELFSAVFQDFSILGGSVAENVAQCSPPETEKVWSCLERAGVRERIERLQDALETRLEKTVYPEAIELSGGELMALEGRYAELFRIQSKYYREGCGDGSDETALIFFFGFRIFAEEKRALDIRMYRQDLYALEAMNRGNSWCINGVFDKLQKGLAGAIGAVTAGLSQCMMGCIYLYVCLKAWYGAFGVGSVTQYVGALLSLAGGISELLSMGAQMRGNTVFLKQVLDYLDIPNEMYQGSLTVEKRSDRQYAVEFKDVSFRYPGSSEYALHHVNMGFQVGEKLAVVGQNGSGKTTFIKLLCRLYDPTEGEILLNGINIRKYDYQEYMSVFSVVFQDFQMLDAPLGENIAAGLYCDGSKAAECLEKAGLGEWFRTKADKGLETWLCQRGNAEEGIQLSGGEGQKLAIARCLYRDAPFVVLDEPTAALDPLAEYEVYTRLNEIVEDKTAIYISHRLSSCRFCDEIAVFHEGQVIEKGSHEGLLSKGGKYAELWNAQAQYYRS